MVVCHGALEGLDLRVRLGLLDGRRPVLLDALTDEGFELRPSSVQLGPQLLLLLEAGARLPKLGLQARLALQRSPQLVELLWQARLALDGSAQVVELR